MNQYNEQPYVKGIWTLQGRKAAGANNKTKPEILPVWSGELACLTAAVSMYLSDAKTLPIYGRPL